MDQINEDDAAEISRLVSQGFIEGILDRDGQRVAWSLDVEVLPR